MPDDLDLENQDDLENNPDPDGDNVDDEGDDLTAEPKDNKDRSQLGRRVSKLETMLEEKLGGFETSLQNMVNQMKPKEPENKPAPNPIETGDPDEWITKGELSTYLAREKEREKEQAQVYVDSYYEALDKLNNDTDPEFRDVIKQEMLKNHNVKHSDNPIFDAQVNYRDAKIALLERGELKRNPLHKNKDGNPPIGGPITNDNGNPPVLPKIKLDNDAKNFIEYTRKTSGRHHIKDDKGLTDEKIQATLSGEAPASLTKGQPKP